MNDFTKEELKSLCEWYNNSDTREYEEKTRTLYKKIQSLIDNYCEHEFYLQGCSESAFVSLDDLIVKLKSRVKVKPKYEVKNIAWVIDDEDEPKEIYIIDIDSSSDEMYLDSNDNWWLEEQLYPSREALIESQIEHWLGMLDMPKQVRFFAKQAKPMKDEDKKCEHE